MDARISASVNLDRAVAQNVVAGLQTRGLESPSTEIIATCDPLSPLQIGRSNLDVSAIARVNHSWRTAEDGLLVALTLLEVKSKPRV
jgi:hypothetical protein